jgi:hypothetical protein
VKRSLLAKAVLRPRVHSAWIELARTQDLGVTHDEARA